MKAFKIDSFEREIRREVTLQNFLHLYEVFEDSLASKLIEKTALKFSAPLNNVLDESALKKVIKDALAH